MTPSQSNLVNPNVSINLPFELAFGQSLPLSVASTLSSSTSVTTVNPAGYASRAVDSIGVEADSYCHEEACQEVRLTDRLQIRLSSLLATDCTTHPGWDEEHAFSLLSKQPPRCRVVSFDFNRKACSSQLFVCMLVGIPPGQAWYYSPLIKAHTPKMRKNMGGQLILCSSGRFPHPEDFDWDLYI
ncbi:unnamed protein product [Protopolystoma xenopodis]|uniref:Uncharacterized protein n=1 Tax=Protopolystoma xenopodis TaxID=117903 RepID=A0A3S4ZL37_9PLAT|nr:unnamed protein product [Protopolystoma xenopodis]